MTTILYYQIQSFVPVVLLLPNRLYETPLIVWTIIKNLDLKWNGFSIEKHYVANLTCCSSDLTIIKCQVLNQIVYELPSEHPLAETRPLRELLGHTPPQVQSFAPPGLSYCEQGMSELNFVNQLASPQNISLGNLSCVDILYSLLSHATRYH
jgi:hypothetical protein